MSLDRLIQEHRNNSRVYAGRAVLETLLDNGDLSVFELRDSCVLAILNFAHRQPEIFDGAYNDIQNMVKSIEGKLTSEKRDAADIPGSSKDNAAGMDED